jgi:hypothetical protein
MIPATLALAMGATAGDPGAAARWDALGGDLLRRTRSAADMLDSSARGGPADPASAVRWARSLARAWRDRVRPEVLAAALSGEPPLTVAATLRPLRAAAPERAARVAEALGPGGPGGSAADLAAGLPEEVAAHLAEGVWERLEWIGRSLADAPPDVWALVAAGEEPLRRAAHRIGLHETAVALTGLDAASLERVLETLPRIDLDPMMRLLREVRAADTADRERVRAAQRNLARADLTQLGGRAFVEVGHRVAAARLRRDYPALAPAVAATAACGELARHLSRMLSERPGRAADAAFGTPTAVVADLLHQYCRAPGLFGPPDPPVSIAGSAGMRERDEP